MKVSVAEMTTLELLNDAIKILEANAHLVKRGDVREAILSAIGLLHVVRYNFVSDESAEK